MTSTPISDFALLSDCRSHALVDREGTIQWLCWPRLDRSSVFASLLGEEAGHWSIRPAHSTGSSAAARSSQRRYLDGSMVLSQSFTTPTGQVALTDALIFGPGERGHQLGHRSPGVLVREVRGVAGTCEMELVMSARPEYGLVVPSIVVVDGGAVLRGGPDVLTLSSPVELDIADGDIRARFRITDGEVVYFALAHRSSDERVPDVIAQETLARRLSDTTTAWRSWTRLHQRYEGPWRDLVHQSGRVLQALTYAPTGAIVAAATTSLPESAGGSRNWDYRYSWVRDASFTIEALWVAACPDEADAFFTFMARSAGSTLARGEELQIMFGVGGEHDLTERELGHLAGWRSSTPVRIGNGAWDQRQLDVYGELLNAAARLPHIVAQCDESTKAFLASLADVAASRWKETDQGIWEVRGGPQHFVYSKLMCWVALDRAIALADALDAGDRVEQWTAVRDDIAAAIDANGWSDRAGAFTQAFGIDDLDASVLMLPIVGFLAPDDPRMVKTLDAIEARLTDPRGLVYRYRAHDGLEGDEGTFLLCTFWFAQACALAGQVERARAVFERAIAYANDVGLLAEEVDPETGELLGNFPQAFSHIGLINAAWAIANASG